MKKISLALIVSVLGIMMTSCSSSVANHATDEPFRSVYHHTPEANWMNDPNGMFYDEVAGVWHLYYQYYPEGTVWGPMHWAHSVSKDLIHWEHRPVAIYPDSLGLIFSGSAVIDRNNTAGFGKNAIVAIYTSASETQKQSIAYSMDGGTTFNKYEGNPVLLGDIQDFRDPKVFWDTISGQWVMTLACQQEVRFYGSPNLKEWTLLSRFGEGFGAHGGVWECPDLVQIDDKWVLIVNLNPGGPFGGSATQYFVGDWNGKEFVPTAHDELPMIKWLDYGKDHYATVTWHNAPYHRVVAIGWMSNWQYACQVPTVAFRSQNTIARDLSLYVDDAGEYRVRVMPSPENEALRGKRIRKPSDACIIELSFTGNKDAVVTLSNDLGEQVLMTLDIKARTFSMDRTVSGDCSFSPDFAAVTTVPLFKSRNEEMSKCNNAKIILFLDHCSIEAFDADGAWAMTNLVFPSAPYNHLDIVGGKATIYDIKK